MQIQESRRPDALTADVTDSQRGFRRTNIQTQVKAQGDAFASVFEAMSTTTTPPRNETPGIVASRPAPDEDEDDEPVPVSSTPTPVQAIGPTPAPAIEPDSTDSQTKRPVGDVPSADAAATRGEVEPDASKNDSGANTRDASPGVAIGDAEQSELTAKDLTAKDLTADDALAAPDAGETMVDVDPSVTAGKQTAVHGDSLNAPPSSPVIASAEKQMVAPESNRPADAAAQASEKSPEREPAVLSRVAEASTHEDRGSRERNQDRTLEPSTRNAANGITAKAADGPSAAVNASAPSVSASLASPALVSPTPAPNQRVDPSLSTGSATAVMAATVAVAAATGAAPASRATGAQTESGAMDGSGTIPGRVAADGSDAATATAPPPTSRTDAADRARLVHRISKAFQKMGIDGGHVRLRMHPDELGVVQLDMQINGRRVSATVSADNDQAAQVLQASLPELRQRLESQGLVIDRLEVRIRDDQTAGSFADQRQNQQPSGNDSRQMGGSRDGVWTQRDSRAASRGVADAFAPSTRSASPMAMTATSRGIDLTV